VERVLASLDIARSGRCLPPPATEIRWRESRPLGLPHAGRLVGGVQLPPQGRHFFTWDPVLRRSPDRPGRRWGTAGVVRRTLAIVDAFAAAHPERVDEWRATIPGFYDDVLQPTDSDLDLLRNIPSAIDMASLMVAGPARPKARSTPDSSGTESKPAERENC
jgi:hypothetical protein